MQRSARFEAVGQSHRGTRLPRADPTLSIKNGIRFILRLMGLTVVNVAYPFAPVRPDAIAGAASGAVCMPSTVQESTSNG